MKFTCRRLQYRGMPEGARHVLAGSVAMVAYPMQQMAALQRSSRQQTYGLRLKASLPSVSYP